MYIFYLWNESKKSLGSYQDVSSSLEPRSEAPAYEVHEISLGLYVLGEPVFRNVVDSVQKFSIPSVRFLNVFF